MKHMMKERNRVLKLARTSSDPEVHQAARHLVKEVKLAVRRETR